MENNLKEFEDIKPEENKCTYNHKDKEIIRKSILSMLKPDCNIVLLESPYCIMLKKLIKKGFTKIKIPNNEEFEDFTEEYKNYVYPFNLGSFLGNFNFEEKLDLVWADFCSTWESTKEQLIPLFERELFNDNSTLIITNSLRASKNNYVSEVLLYLNKISEYSGYTINIMGDTSTCGNGMFSIFLKINYSNKPRCPKCFSSNVKKRGFRYTKFEVTQRHQCKLCDFRFSIDANRLHTPKNIRKFIYNKLKEEKSSRQISREIKEKFDVYVSHNTVLRCLKDSERYLGKKITPKKVKKKIWIKPHKINTNGNIKNKEGYFVKKEILTI